MQNYFVGKANIDKDGNKSYNNYKQTCDNKKEGIQNVIVYVKGTLDAPVITAVIEIDADNETKLSELRRTVYEAERRGIQQKTEGIFRRYDSFDYANARNEQSGLRKVAGYNNQLGAERGTSNGAVERAVSYRTTEEGHKVYYSENDIAPINEVSSTDDAFFDAENWQGEIESLYKTVLDGVPPKKTYTQKHGSRALLTTVLFISDNLNYKAFLRTRAHQPFSARFSTTSKPFTSRTLITSSARSVIIPEASSTASSFI